MSGKVYLINVVLIMVVFYLGLQVHGEWTNDGSAVVFPAGDESPTPPSPERRPRFRTDPPASAYRIVSEKNLFSPDRTGPEPETLDPEPVPQAGGAPDGLVVFGVMISGEDKSALIGEADQSMGRRGRWIKEGDSIYGYRVSSIDSDRLTLSGPNREYTISLYERRNRHESVKPRGDGPTVVQAGGKSEPRTPERPSDAEADPKPVERKKEPSVSVKPPPPEPAKTKGNADKPSPSKEVAEPDRDRSPNERENKAITPFGNLLRNLKRSHDEPN